MSGPHRIGNDIVDLALEGSLLQPGIAARNLQRFCARVCTPREAAWLGDCGMRARDVWSLWAAKEAAFKAAHREGWLSRFDFIPREFEVQPNASCTRARVRWRRSPIRGLRVRFDQQPAYIHAICEEQNTPPCLIVIARHCPESGDESRAVREVVCRQLAARFGIARDDLAIAGGGDTGRPPELIWRTAGTRAFRMPISLSHHGVWLAAAVPVATIMQSKCRAHIIRKIYERNRSESF